MAPKANSSRSKRYGPQVRAEKRYYLANKVQRDLDSRAWRKRNPEKFAAIDKCWKKNHMPQINKRDRERYKNKSLASRREAYLWKRYGLSMDQYAAMFAAQGGACAVCRRPPQRISLNVDHDHVTGLIRGLLCPYCNKRVVGRHRVSTLLQNAAKYLERKTPLGLAESIIVRRRKNKGR